MKKFHVFLLTLLVSLLTGLVVDVANSATVYRSIKAFAEQIVAPSIRVSPSTRDEGTNVFTVHDLGGTNFFRITATGTNALPTVTSNGIPYTGVTATIGASNYNIGSSVANGFRLYTFRNGLLISTNSQ